MNLSEIDTLFVQENGMEIESGDKSPHSKIWLRQRRDRKPTVWIARLPWGLALVAGVLVVIGCLAIGRCEELAGGSGRFLRHQMVWVVLAVMVAGIASVPNYRVLCRWSYPIYGLALLLLVVVYFFPAVNGARRWIRLGPIGFQPSEFAKVALVLAMARYLMYRNDHRRLVGLFVPLALMLVPVLLILREPDLGTALVFLPVTFLMLFTAGARRADLLRLALVGLLLVPLLWSQMSREQQSRVTALFDQTQPGDPVSPDAYHLRQAKRMLAMGGVWGSLIVQTAVDDPAAYHLPEAQSDFIFCVIGERFGLIGIAVLLILFALFAWRGLEIAHATREPFGRLTAVGLVAIVSVQVVINTAMTVGLLPITGLSLPWISYGGSGLLTQGLILGLLCNIGLRPGYEVAAEPFRYTIE